MAVLTEVITRLEPSLAAGRIAAAARRAQQGPAKLRRLTWAIEDAPGLLTGDGVHAPMPAVLRLIDELCDAGARPSPVRRARGAAGSSGWPSGSAGSGWARPWPCPAEHQGGHRPAGLAHRARPDPGHHRADRPGRLAQPAPTSHLPRRRRELHPLGQEAQADPAWTHAAARWSGPLWRDGHRKTRWEQARLAAARQRAEIRRPRRRVARPPLRPTAGRDQPPHSRPCRAPSDDQPRLPGSAASRSSSPNPSTPWSCSLAATRHGPRRHRRPRAPPPGCSRRPPRPAHQRLPARRTPAPARHPFRAVQLRRAVPLATDLPAAILARMLGIHIQRRRHLAACLRRRLGRLRRRRQPPPGTLTRCPACPNSTSPASAAGAQQRVPPHARDQVRVECDIGSRQLTITECRPPWRQGTGPEWTRFPIARLHYTQATKMWTLYWRDHNLRFHRYDQLEPSPGHQRPAARDRARPDRDLLGIGPPG